MTRPFDFTWTVPGWGFEFIDVPGVPGEKPGKVRCLVDRLAPAGQFDITKPLEQTSLFRDFAALHPATEESIRAFAHAHGRLFHPPALWEHDPRYAPLLGTALVPLADRGLDAMRSGDFGTGEPIEYWQHQAAEMAAAVALWESAESAEDATEQYRDLLLLINSQLSGHSYAPVLGLNRSEVLRQMSRDKSAFHIASDVLVFQVVPESLIGALWMSFAQAIANAAEFRQCEGCQKYFEVYRDKREDARFCGDTCRSRAYRQRKEEARKLRASGMSVKKIAEKLGSDEKTVKGWVKK